MIVDAVGNHAQLGIRRVLTPTANLLLIGGSAGKWINGLGNIAKAAALSPFVSQKMFSFLAETNKADLLVLNELIEAGKIRPVIDRTYPLSEAPEAIRHLETGHARGRVVVIV